MRTGSAGSSRMGTGYCGDSCEALAAAGSALSIIGYN